MKERILLYDLETSYIITEEARWGFWDDRPIRRKVIQDWQILCFAYKWYGDKKTYVVAQNDFKDYIPGKINDYSVCKALHDLFNQADIICGHNSVAFDDKKSNARFIQHKLPPTPHIIQQDTKKMAKKRFGFTSNKLADLATNLGVEAKADAGGIETWDGCMAGDKKAWKHMKSYNKQDVVVLEQIYEILRPWVKNPPMNVIADVPDGCYLCHSNKLQKRGYNHSKTGKKQRYQCMDCGAWNSGRNLIPLYNEVVS